VLALQRLFYHLAAAYMAVSATILEVHEGEPIRKILMLSWAAFRTPALVYVLGYVQNSAKTLEEGVTVK
jgi:hypothetical protein